MPWGGGMLRAGLSAYEEPMPTNMPTASAEVIVLEIAGGESSQTKLASNTMTPEMTGEASATPFPASFSPELSATLSSTAPTPLPTPTSTPTLDLGEEEKKVKLELAADELNSYRSPNRMRPAEIDAVLKTLPEGLPLCRTMIVLKAYSLLGKVPYQYGGKSRALGWDTDWGKYGSMVLGGQVYVNSEPNGLDCSGFVRWCFINAAGTVDIGVRMGSGTYKQWLSSRPIAMSDALPGDLVFTNEVGRTNHNGIVVQNDRGKLMVIHCARDKGIVLEVMTESKFRFARRPDALWGKGVEMLDAAVLRHKNAAEMVDLRYVLAVRDV